MKSISVPSVRDFSQLDKFAEGRIDCVDWPEKYPYCPEVSFKIAHDGEKLLVHFDVTEENTRAVSTEFNGHVWEDSCVELFVKPVDDPYYVNLETNCIGAGLAARRTCRADAVMFKSDPIVRRSSLPFEPINASGMTSWWVEIEVPFKLITNGKEGKPDALMANLYKCGDKMAVPHFLSWCPVTAPEPEFHKPEYFGKLIIE